MLRLIALLFLFGSGCISPSFAASAVQVSMLSSTCFQKSTKPFCKAEVLIFLPSQNAVVACVASGLNADKPGDTLFCRAKTDLGASASTSIAVPHSLAPVTVAGSFAWPTFFAIDEANFTIAHCHVEPASQAAQTQPSATCGGRVPIPH